jgi:hypothetical protein
MMKNARGLWQVLVKLLMKRMKRWMKEKQTQPKDWG